MIFEQIILSKNIRIWLKFGFQLPKDMRLELIGKHSSCSEHISEQAVGIRLRIHFSEQRVMHQLPSTIIFSKILRLKCQFGKSAEIYVILLFVYIFPFEEEKNPHTGDTESFDQCR